jgi:hypothetical protein
VNARTLVVLAGVTVLAGCASGASTVDEESPERPAKAARQLLDIDDRTGEASGTFRVARGTTQIELTAFCKPVGRDVSRPRVSFVVDSGSPGDDVLTFESECATDSGVSSGTSLPEGTAGELTYRVTPSDSRNITWSLTVTGS